MPPSTPRFHLSCRRAAAAAAAAAAFVFIVVVVVTAATAARRTSEITSGFVSVAERGGSDIQSVRVNQGLESYQEGHKGW
jgi:hypothetical protein